MQLLLRDLADASNAVCGRTELEEALQEVLSVVKVVNDSIRAAEVVIRGLPSALAPLGVPSAQEFFMVTTENGPQSGGLFARNRSQRRQVFLHDSHVVFCKPLDKEKDDQDGGGGGNKFQFKFAVGTAGLGMSTVVSEKSRFF